MRALVPARVFVVMVVLVAVAAAGAVALGGCGGGARSTVPRGAGDERVRLPSGRDRGDAAGSAAARPALCGRLAVRVVGRVRDAAATELSGLVASRTQPGVLWAHNDSGDRARIFALRASDADVLASLNVPGAQAVDWEDIATGPHGDLLLGDIGDNDARRPDVVVYRVPEPRLAEHPATTAPATALTLHYPDGPHDAETLLADRRTGEILIVTKAFSGRSGVYVARLGGGSGASGGDEGDAGATQRLRLAGHVDLGLGGLATAGDVSADGRTIALRTYTSLYVWRRKPGISLARTLVDARPCVSKTGLAAEGQGESLALVDDGHAFYTVPEGPSPRLRHYTAR